MTVGVAEIPGRVAEGLVVRVCAGAAMVNGALAICLSSPCPQPVHTVIVYAPGAVPPAIVTRYERWIGEDGEWSLMHAVPVERR